MTLEISHEQRVMNNDAPNSLIFTTPILLVETHINLQANVLVTKGATLVQFFRISFVLQEEPSE